ncbi:hypothetical protein SCLCIDRAFT_34661 [Scleroderma citrinum Foug A]|uniref:Retrotransposon gag domain-containing protein n=1 Tax=Scleroderma citrinum Foug A TaxID=1036808 RepID=A0A0C2ZAJ9_9AGAM|nr:hypothetical protein SCLCIDRAFT_34661 [Scleroderma citrinum Foug A]
MHPNASQLPTLVVLLLSVHLLALGTPPPLSPNSEASPLRKALPLLVVPPEDNAPGDSGPGDDGPNGNGPNGDDPSDNDPQPHDDDDDDDDDDDEGEPLDGLPGQDDAGMIIFNNLSITIYRLVRKPNTFDSTDSKKLHTFFVQCELNFQDWPKAFWTDRAKADLLGMDDPDACPLWMTSWCEFIIELQTTFGPHDPVADAEHQLDHLCMKDTHHINRYVVDFNQIMSQVWGYGDGALHHHFYSGLPN